MAFMKVGDLKWISVWCREFKKNFGTVYIGAAEDNVIPDSVPEPESNKATSTSGVQFAVISALMSVFLTL